MEQLNRGQSMPMNNEVNKETREIENGIESKL